MNRDEECARSTVSKEAAGLCSKPLKRKERDPEASVFQRGDEDECCTYLPGVSVK